MANRQDISSQEKVSQDKKNQRGAKRPTSYDVARHAGVSQAAVSRAFSKRGYVGKEARAKIEAAAKELGFRPNALARSLIDKRSRIVAVVIADMYYSFYVAILHQINSALREAGYQTLLFSIPSSQDLDSVVDDVGEYRVDGVIMVSARLTTDVAGMSEALGVPIVLMNRYADQPSANFVIPDDRQGARLAAEFMLAAGHHRFAYIAGLDGASTSRDRGAGFREMLPASPQTQVGDFTYEGGFAATEALMRGPAPPDAIFCASDIMAWAAVDALRHEFGLRAGRDVSVIGFNDAAESRWRNYDLTTVVSSPDSMSHRAVEILSAILDGEATPPVQERLKTHLKVRGSARIPSDYTAQQVELETGK